MNLVNHILIYMTKLKKKILIKNNENLKYLNDVSGNLLQIFEGNDNWSGDQCQILYVRNFMSFLFFYLFIYLFIFFQKMRTNEILCGKK